MKKETRAAETAGPAWTDKATALPVYAVVALTLSFVWFSDLVEVSFESRGMSLLLNTLLVTGVSAWGAALALRGYLYSGLSTMLYAGCGLVAMGASFLISSLSIGAVHGPNVAVTVHNLGVFCASFFHLAAALRAGRPGVTKSAPSAFKAAAAYLAVLALTGLFWAAAQYDLSPVFFLPGEGTTPVRQLVLTVSVAILAAAAAFLIRQASRRGSLSVRCYGLGLVLIAMGLVDVSIAVPGSVLSWTGRLSQSLGSLYLLAAFMVAIRSALKAGLDVRAAAADYFLESEDHYRALVNALRAAVISLDPKGRVVLWNPQAEAISGYSHAEAAGRPLSDLMAPDGDGHEAFLQALKDRSGRYLEMTLRRKDGLAFPADVLVFAAAGGWTKWTNLIIRETSDRRHFEETLRRYELLSANSRDIILHIQHDNGRILEANAAAIAAYGYSREELLRMTIQDLRTPGTSAQTGAQMDEGERNGILFESRHQRKDGSTFPVEVSSQGATIGGVRTLVSVVRDITDRKRAEEALRDSIQRFELVVTGAHAAIWDWDVVKKRVFFSPQWKALRGFAEDELTDREEEWSSRIHPDDAPGVFSAVRAHFEGRTPVFAQEYRTRCKDGSWKWIFDHGLALRDDGGCIVRMAGSELDISERKEAEAELRKRELRLRQALLVSRSFAFEWNPATDEVSRSEECGPLLGLHGETAIRDSGADFFQRVHPGDRERFTSVLRGLTPESPSYVTQYRLVRPDGRVITLEETGLGTFDAAGRLDRLTGITTDVTDREKAAAEVVYLATFPKCNPNPIVEADPDGQVRFCNPVAADLFPDLPQRGKDHPWLIDWSKVTGSLGNGLQNRGEREVAVGDKWYYQTLHFIPESRSFRIYGVDITGLKDAERALHNTHDRVVTILESISDGFFSLDRQFRVTFVNETGAKAIGQTRETMTGRILWEIFPAAVGSDFERAYQTAMTERVTATTESFYPPLNAWFEAHAYPFEDGISVFFRDVTHRKRVEQTLRENQTDLNLAQYVGRIGSWRLNVQRNELLWSDENYRIFGVPKGTRLSYETFLAIVHPEDRAVVDRQWMAALQGEPYDVEHRIVVGNAVKWVRERAELEFDAEGQLSGGFGITQDISDRKQSEKALRESEEALRKANEELEEAVRKRTRALEDTVAALKNEVVVRKNTQTQLRQLSRVFMDAADPIIIEDLSGKIVELNREAEVVYGWSREELIGTPIDTLFLPEREPLAARLRERCCAGEEIRNWEGLRKARSGRIIPNLLTAFPLLDESGQVAFVATISKDISARKEMEEQLNEAQRHLQALSRKSMVALEADRRSVARELHDSIGGSLAAIKFGLEEVAGQVVRDPAGGSRLLETLISHLADAIKETKRISANLRPLSIDDLGLLATIEWYTRQFSQRYEDIRLVRQIEVQEHEIPEDYKIVVYRVMQEALTNAARHSKADTINIRLKKEAGCLELEVEDNGCGFNPRKAYEAGDGLSGYGLRSMQERAEICGGSITIHSRPGAGTHIRAALPVSKILAER